MELTINGEKRTIENAETLEDVMRSLGLSPDSGGVAVAVNDTVVPRSRWKSTRIRPSDAIEVIHAVQGG
jgi:sulfur carrier protein